MVRISQEWVRKITAAWEFYHPEDARRLATLADYRLSSSGRRNSHNIPSIDPSDYIIQQALGPAAAAGNWQRPAKLPSDSERLRRSFDPQPSTGDSPTRGIGQSRNDPLQGPYQTTSPVRRKASSAPNTANLRAYALSPQRQTYRVEVRTTDCQYTSFQTKLTTTF